MNPLIFLAAFLLCSCSFSNVPLTSESNQTLVPAKTEAALASERPEQNDVTKSISAESLNTIPVIGKLGVPLGKVTTIMAIIVDGDSLGTKGDAGSYLLKIIEVDGTKLDTEPIVDFALAPGVNVKLANNDFDLYELKSGKKSGSLTGEQITKLKEDYVGKSMLLQVYELGRFTGIPNNMPKEVPTWQDYGFHFRTYLRVLREINAK